MRFKKILKTFASIALSLTMLIGSAFCDDTTISDTDMHTASGTIQLTVGGSPAASSVTLQLPAIFYLEKNDVLSALDDEDEYSDDNDVYIADCSVNVDITNLQGENVFYAFASSSATLTEQGDDQHYNTLIPLTTDVGGVGSRGAWIARTFSHRNWNLQITALETYDEDRSGSPAEKLTNTHMKLDDVWTGTYSDGMIFSPDDDTEYIRDSYFNLNLATLVMYTEAGDEFSSITGEFCIHYGIADDVSSIPYKY